MPDLFFSDIELTDGLSFQLFKELDIAVPIIFCTAYNHYSLEAFKVYGIDYILKPFHTHAIEHALKKYMNLTSHKEDGPVMDLKAIIGSIEKNTRVQNILVRMADKIIPINMEDIALVFLANGLVKITTFDESTYVVSDTLEKLSKRLDTSFFRINRQKNFLFIYMLR